MVTLSIALLLAAVASFPALDAARDTQDRAALQRLTSESAAVAAKQPEDPGAQYRHAVSASYLAEVALEQRDKVAAKNAAEEGIGAAEKAVALRPDVSEHHRILGTLCGQIIPANTWLAMKYGRCALDSINKAIELDGKSARAYLSRGVGNYYLPSAFGGGVEKAVQDFNKALELNPKLAEAHLWMGLAWRKANRNSEARAEFQKSLELNPRRVWAKQQLEKTPAQ
jgi:tetratricopeptide (TPR) repeat protein